VSHKFGWQPRFVFILIEAAFLYDYAELFFSPLLYTTQNLRAYVRMHVCMHARMYAYTYACMHACVQVREHGGKHMWAQINVNWA